MLSRRTGPDGGGYGRPRECRPLRGAHRVWAPGPPARGPGPSCRSCWPRSLGCPSRGLAPSGPPPAPQRGALYWNDVAGRSGGLGSWRVTLGCCPERRGPGRSPGRRRPRTTAEMLAPFRSRSARVAGLGRERSGTAAPVDAAGSGATGGEVRCGLLVRADRGRDRRTARPARPRLTSVFR
jgi:hypothetical protein